MNVISVFIAIIWSGRIIVNVFSYIYLWFIKEYRVDRMLIHLRTAEGKRIFFPSMRRPPVSPKAIALVGATLIALGLLYIVLPLFSLAKLLLLDLLSFPITFVFVVFANIPTVLYHQWVIRTAVGKLRSHKKMTVVGITGSFGKTSTKDFLATILAREFRVMKTEASKNAPIGIAEAIVKHLEPRDQVFVVEMGAYKPGEVSEMARMVLPEVAILTAINPQHQDLFGTIEQTKKAKYELVQGLSGRGIVICNADNPGTREMGQWAIRDGYAVWWYSTKSKKTFYATDIEADTQGIKFWCRYENKSAEVHARVLGEHQVGNLLAAIAGAVACGMSLKDAAKAVADITPTPKVMQLVPGVNGSMFINDTFNNNPDAAIAALKFLSQFRGKKFLVFTPMIELGSFSASSHESVGEQAGKICDAIMLTNHNFYSSFERGVRKSSPTVPLMVLSPARGAAYIQKHTKQDDVVLFKGKEAEAVFRKL